MHKKIAASTFVQRQTADSRFSHYEGTWESLEKLVEQRLPDAKKGYREGVILVPVPPECFWSSVVPIDENSVISGTVERRRPEEAPVIIVTAAGKKCPAGYVEVVLYSHDVLTENHEESADSDWEVVSINASPDSQPVPMNPVAMARNTLQMVGGTKGEYSAEDWARSTWFWATHAQVK